MLSMSGQVQIEHVNEKRERTAQLCNMLKITTSLVLHYAHDFCEFEKTQGQNGVPTRLIYEAPDIYQGLVHKPVLCSREPLWAWYFKTINPNPYRRLPGIFCFRLFGYNLTRTWYPYQRHIFSCRGMIPRNRWSGSSTQS